MDNKMEKSKKKVLGMSIRPGLLVVVVAILSLEATGLIQYYYSLQGIKREANQRAQSGLRGMENRIMDIVNQAEGALTNSLWVVEWCLDYPDSLVRVPQRVVELNPAVVGSTIALVPGFSKRFPLYSPYVTRDMDSGGLVTLSLATDDYDYPSQEWFTQPLSTGEGYWSEPYFDEGGGNMLMTTFSLPVKDRRGKVAAILTADISLNWLAELVESTKPYPNAYTTILSRGGRLVVSTANDSAAATYADKDVIRYSTAVERTGWMLTTAIPEDDLFAGTRKVGLVVKLLQILSIALIVVILRIIAKNQMKYNKLSAQKDIIQNELRIGHGIQMAMVPKTFPPFPQRNDLDIAASIVPAKEVGGDLYDFYIRDEKLFFCIGDVSGKGVPAALVMTVTQSLFRATSSHENSPAKIVAFMNDSMAEKNENSMFATFFCGALDLVTGQLRYCNAGHNPPVVIGKAKRKVDILPVVPNIPLALDAGFPFQEQQTTLDCGDTLFLYTDGLTEAENVALEQFGESRMVDRLNVSLRDCVDEALADRYSVSQSILDNVRSAVADFVADAPQSDDLTMLVVRYLQHGDAVKRERHLILHNDIQQIPQLADFMETIADEKGLSQNDTMSLNLALEEAVTNVILYAYPSEADGLVDIEAVLHEHSIEFIITDSGAPFDPTAAPEADVSLPPEDRSVGGLGIYLVRQLMDEVRYQRVDDKNVLTMVKNI